MSNSLSYYRIINFARMIHIYISVITERRKCTVYRNVLSMKVQRKIVCILFVQSIVTICRQNGFITKILKSLCSGLRCHACEQHRIQRSALKRVFLARRPSRLENTGNWISVREKMLEYIGVCTGRKFRARSRRGKQRRVRLRKYRLRVSPFEARQESRDYFSPRDCRERVIFRMRHVRLITPPLPQCTIRTRKQTQHASNVSADYNGMTIKFPRDIGRYEKQ